MLDPPRGPLPVTVLTGFLGAGKTTLLRRIVRELPGVRIGLLINEMGPAGIDPQAASERLIELSQGCVCCVQNTDLQVALRELHARGDLDRVVIETTGLAALARLDGVLTVVDAANFGLTDVDEWRAQIVGADLIVLSKLDLVPPETAARTRAAVLALCPGARLLDITDAPAAVLLDPAPDDVPALADPAAAGAGGPEHDAAACHDPTHQHGPAPHARHSDFRTVAFAARQDYDAARLEDLLEALPPEVFRAKGIARTGARWLGFQAVGGRLHCDPDAAPPAHGQSRLVFFGRNLDGATLGARLALCQRAGSG